MKSVKSVLIKKGFIEVVTMGEVSPDFAQSPEVARLKAYRLLKPYEEDKLGGEEEMEEEEEKDVGECMYVGGIVGGREGDGALIYRIALFFPQDPSCQTPVVFELPLEMQGYKLIDSCGPEGITNSVSHMTVK